MDSNNIFYHVIGYSSNTGYGIHIKEVCKVLAKYKKNYLLTDLNNLVDKDKVNDILQTFKPSHVIYNISINYGSQCWNDVKSYHGLKIGWIVWESTII
jgi:hypothetical protein